MVSHAVSSSPLMLSRILASPLMLKCRLSRQCRTKLVLLTTTAAITLTITPSLRVRISNAVLNGVPARRLQLVIRCWPRKQVYLQISTTLWDVKCQGHSKSNIKTMNIQCTMFVCEIVSFLQNFDQLHYRYISISITETSNVTAVSDVRSASARLFAGTWRP